MSITFMIGGKNSVLLNQLEIFKKLGTEYMQWNLSWADYHQYQSCYVHFTPEFGFKMDHN